MSGKGIESKITPTTSAASITDNAVVRGDGGGKVVQESVTTIDDSGNVDFKGGTLKDDTIASPVSLITLLKGILPYTTKTDPAVDAISTADIDSFGGCLITLTAAGNSQTLPSPTDTAVYHQFSVANDSASTDNIPVNGVAIEPGEFVKFLWITGSSVWVHEDDSGIWFEDGTDAKTQDSSLNIDLQSGKLKDVNATAGITVGDASNAALNGLFAATSLLGANNELKLIRLNHPAYAATIAITADDMSSLYEIDTSGGNVAVTIPDADSSTHERWLNIIKKTSDTNFVTVQTATLQLIGGTNSQVISEYKKGFSVVASGGDSEYEITQDNRFGEPAKGALSMFLSDTASGIGGYLTMYPEDTGGVESSVATAALGVGAAQLIEEWATETGVPGLTSLQGGVYNMHFHAAKTGSKAATVFFRLYKRVLAGTETLLLTSENSNLITTKSSFSVDASLPTAVTLLATDRLVLKAYVNVTGVGADATTTIYMEGDTVTRLSIPASSIQLDTRYLVKSAFGSAQTVVSDVVFSEPVKITKAAGGYLLEMGTATNAATPRVAMETKNSGFAAPPNCNALSNGDKWVFWNGADYRGAIGFDARTMWFQSTEGSATDNNRFKFFAGSAGVPVEVLVLGDGNVGFIWNDTGIDIDFRVEAVGVTHAFFIDGADGTPRLGKLTVAGGLVQTDGSGNLSSSVTLPDGTLATTQTASDNSTKLATTAYVDTGDSAKATTELDNLGTTAINASLIPDTTDTLGLGNLTYVWDQLFARAVSAGNTVAKTLYLRAIDTDTSGFVNFITLTSNSAPTCEIAGAVTGTTQSPVDNSTKLATTAYVETAKRTVYNTQTSTAYTLVLADKNKTVVMANGASDYALTFPDSVFTVGDKGRVWKTGSGDITGTDSGSIAFVTAIGDVNWKIDGSVPYYIEWELTATDVYTISGPIRAV